MKNSKGITANGQNGNNSRQSTSRRAKINKDYQIVSRGWNKLSKINVTENNDSIFSHLKSGVKSAGRATQIPSISRLTINSAADGNTKVSRLGILSPRTANVSAFEHSNTQSKIKKPTLIKHNSSSSKDYSKNKNNGNFKRARSQINSINKQIKK